MTMALSEKVVTASMFERQGTLQSRSGQGRADTEQGKREARTQSVRVNCKTNHYHFENIYAPPADRSTTPHDGTAQCPYNLAHHSSR
jgi:hypothetical protein